MTRHLRISYRHTVRHLQVWSEIIYVMYGSSEPSKMLVISPALARGVTTALIKFWPKHVRLAITHIILGCDTSTFGHAFTFRRNNESLTGICGDIDLG